MAKRIEVVHEVLKEIIHDDTDANRVVDGERFKLQTDSCFVRYLLVAKHFLKESEVCLRCDAEANQPSFKFN